jgi:hypothetical protein
MTKQQIDAALAPKTIVSRADCCGALDACMKAANTQGGWPCGFVALFGACQPGASGKVCRRCAETRAKAAVPAGVRPAIKAACTDAAVKAAVLPGG